MQEHVGDKLVDMEFTSQEEMQPQHPCQVDAAAFKHKCGNECQDIHHQQILGHCGYIVHFYYYDYSFYYFQLMEANIPYFSLFAHKITKNIRFYAQKRAITNFFS